MEDRIVKSRKRFNELVLEYEDTKKLIHALPEGNNKDKRLSKLYMMKTIINIMEGNIKVLELISKGELWKTIT